MRTARRDNPCGSGSLTTRPPSDRKRRRRRWSVTLARRLRGHAQGPSGTSASGALTPCLLILEHLSLELVLLRDRTCLGRLLLVMSLVLLRLAFFTKVIAAGDAPDRLFQLALDLVAGTHGRPNLLWSLTWIEYPVTKDRSSPRPVAQRYRPVCQHPDLRISPWHPRPGVPVLDHRQPRHHRAVVESRRSPPAQPAEHPHRLYQQRLLGDLQPRRAHPWPPPAVTTPRGCGMLETPFIPSCWLP